MTQNKKLTVNGREVEFTTERNLLEVIRKAGINLPTFCYHSELSIYGACRLCLVLVEGKGVMAACSTAPADGMVIHTDTEELRNMRKITIELLLANHQVECPTCSRAENCTLQQIAFRLGISKVRFKKLAKPKPRDLSSPALERDPNKCVLCGDCVRVCREIQGIGAIDFAWRGASAQVTPAFGNLLGTAECVNCGQCAAVCPTGAIVPHQDRQKVWDNLYDKTKTVVVQIAPAVRVALGEYFGAKPGENIAGKLVAALKLMGFKHVYDTSFTADMTIFEEATELVKRISEGGTLPMFTSCCPAWVKYAEIYYPEFLPCLSSCRSPQAMFGAVAKKILPAQLGIDRKDLVVVSIMPCTAKKAEAQLPKFRDENGKQEVDIVVTTSELQRMINSCGIRLEELEPEAFDMPMGFATGAGVIFGTTGGVMEAALRYAVEKLDGKPLGNVVFKEVRGMNSLKETAVTAGGIELKVAVVYGLANARKLLDNIRAGKAHYNFVEVMACPGGCISGGGQPAGASRTLRALRQKGLYMADKSNQLQKPQENYLVEKYYTDFIGGHPGSREAHKLLHTAYQNRSQIFDAKIPVMRGTAEKRLLVTVTLCAEQERCPGQFLLDMISSYLKEKNYIDRVDLDAAFSARAEEDGTVCVSIGERIVEKAKINSELNTLEKLQNRAAFKIVAEQIDQGIADL